jgi:hypothetical protein
VQPARLPRLLQDRTPLLTDYTKNHDYAGKDALLTTDPEKAILGTDIASDLDEIVTAIASKYDNTDIASQAQAEAGTSNTVLMTPLRVSQFLADSGGGGAGVLIDLIALTDPGADRILFWDESANNTTWLTVSTGLTLTGTNLTVDATVLDHDTLTNFVANEHINHTSVVLTLEEGLQWSTGGTDISASATAKLDFSGLVEETTLDIANDDFVFWDNSAGLHRKAPIENIIGDALGDGKWYRSSTQALSAATEATVAFNAADNDNLERGTFSTVTGEYTVGAAATRIWITASLTVAAINDDESFEIEIQDDGVTVLRARVYNDTDNDTPEQTYQCSGQISLAAASVVRVRATCSSAETISAGTSVSNVSIMELA